MQALHALSFYILFCIKPTKLEILVKISKNQQNFWHKPQKYYYYEVTYISI